VYVVNYTASHSFHRQRLDYSPDRTNLSTGIWGRWWKNGEKGYNSNDDDDNNNDDDDDDDYNYDDDNNNNDNSPVGPDRLLAQPASHSTSTGALSLE